LTGAMANFQEGGVIGRIWRVLFAESRSPLIRDFCEMWIRAGSG